MKISVLRAASGILASLGLAAVLVSCANSSKTGTDPNSYDNLIGQYESLILLQQQQLEALKAIQYLQNQNNTEKLPPAQSNEQKNEQSSDKIPDTPSNPNSGTQISPPSETDTESPAQNPVQNSLQFLLWKEEDGGILITGCNPTCTNLTIPSSINGIPVLKIAENAFAGSSLQTVVIEEGIRELGWFAFYECADLVSVTLPKSVTKIGYAAFDGSAKGFRIRCYADSYAEKFARSFAIPTSTLGE